MMKIREYFKAQEEVSRVSAELKKISYIHIILKSGEIDTITGHREIENFISNVLFESHFIADDIDEIRVVVRHDKTKELLEEILHELQDVVDVKYVVAKKKFWE